MPKPLLSYKELQQIRGTLRLHQSPYGAWRDETNQAIVLLDVALSKQNLVHEQVVEEGFGASWVFCRHCHKEWTEQMENTRCLNRY